MKPLILGLLLIGLLIAPLTADTRHRAPILAFMKLSGYPKGRPGYVIDHIIPLCAGGKDEPSNMQWQELAASYRKDVFERALCAAMKKQGMLIVPVVKP